MGRIIRSTGDPAFMLSVARLVPEAIGFRGDFRPDAIADRRMIFKPPGS